MSEEEDDGEGEGGIAVRERAEHKAEPPRRFKVLLLNDDFTTQQFVVDVLQTVFLKSFPEAFMLMLKVHHEGSAVCGIYPAQIAETKISIVHARARDAGYPLRCAMEPE